MSKQLSYSELKRRLSGAGLWPEGRMARIACYLLGLAAALFALQSLLSWLAPAWGANLGGWVDFLTFIAGVLFSILAFRWLKRRILWRLRNRLIVTYIFIGVIPVVLLVTLGFVTLYLFAGQFSGFVVTSELNSQMRSASVSASPSGTMIPASPITLGISPESDPITGTSQAIASSAAKPNDSS